MPPTAQEEDVPEWDRRYFCGQCDPHLQPKDGFGLVAFHEHGQSHTLEALRDAVAQGRQMRAALRDIRGFVRLLGRPDWEEARRNGPLVAWQVDWHAARGLGEELPEPDSSLLTKEGQGQ